MFGGTKVPKGVSSGAPPRQGRPLSGRIGVAGHAATCAGQIGTAFHVARRERGRFGHTDGPESQDPGTEARPQGRENNCEADQASHRQVRPARNREWQDEQVALIRVKRSLAASVVRSTASIAGFDAPRATGISGVLSP